jgi:glycosyltransferase involved in cell wall biosynthesis
MIRIGFIGNVSSQWMGGMNYYKNLLFAIASLKDKDIEVYIFVGCKADDEIKTLFAEYSIVVQDSMFDKNSFSWYIGKIFKKFFNSSFLLEKVLKKYKINVLSHSGITKLQCCKTINWIPDFQHIHLPHMFSSDEIKRRNTNFQRIIKESDKVVVSSYDAEKDLNIMINGYKNKVNVLQFVSQPKDKYFRLNDENKKKLVEKYDLPNEFYYIPNQFWKHKNHMLVFESIKKLKDKNIKVGVVFTGHMDDYRNKEYIEEIRSYISLHKLDENVSLLGLIDYEDVFTLIKFSIAVINPSLFEGWSSTVEECKSVGKHMILSDLNVHKEQCPEAQFFDRNSAESLVNTVENYTISCNNSNLALEERTKAFADKYIKIAKEAINDK